MMTVCKHHYPLYAALLLWLLSSPQVATQDPDILSKNPPIYKLFSADTDQTTVVAPFLKLINYPPSTPITIPEVRLHSAEYTFPGKVPSRPGSVSFIFVPLKKYDKPPAYTVTADGSELSSGETTLREVCCIESRGHTERPQQVVVSVPVEAVQRVTQAQKIELRLLSKRGNHSFKLNKSGRESVAALLATIK